MNLKHLSMAVALAPERSAKFRSACFSFSA